MFNEPLGVIFKKMPKVIDFENKRNFFRLELKHLKGNVRHRMPIRLRIRRKEIFNDSFQRFKKLQAQDLKGRFQIEFVGEEGLDATGLSKEWYLKLSQEIFNPNYALFTLSQNGAS